MQTFKQRALEIADKAANSKTTLASDTFLSGLDDDERRCE